MQAVGLSLETIDVRFDTMRVVFVSFFQNQAKFLNRKRWYSTTTTTAATETTTTATATTAAAAKQQQQR